MGWRGSEHLTELMSLFIAVDLNQMAFMSIFQLKQFYYMTPMLSSTLEDPFLYPLRGDSAGKHLILQEEA